MKKIMFLYLLMSVFMFSSCEKDVSVIEKDSSDIVSPKCVFEDGVVYPLTNNQTRVLYANSGLNWEYDTKVQLPNGEFVDYPWVDGDNLTFSMKEKLRSEDGWELIAHSMRPNTEINKAYLIFHNYITGVLRVFSYVRVYSPNNNGFWKITFQNPNKLLNFANPYAIPYDSTDGSLDVIVANHTINSDKGFGLGWNGFQIELAYDPNATGIMHISACNSTLTQINLDGKYNGLTEGVILSQTKSSTLVSDGLKGVGSLAGSAAKGWVEKNSQNIKIPFVSSDKFSDLAKKGVTAIFDSFAGLFEKNTTETKNVRLTTNGTIKVEGFSVQDSPAPLQSININLNLIDGKLGGWNLNSHPIVYWKSAGIYEPRPDNADISFSDFYYRTKGIERVEYSLMFNPKSQNMLSRQSISYNLVNFDGSAKPEPTYTISSYGALGNHNGYFGVYAAFTDMYRDGSLSIRRLNSDAYLKTNVFGVTGQPNPYTDLATDPNAIKLGGLMTLKFKFLPNFIFTINGIEKEYYGTKTFQCKHEWGKFDLADIYD